MKTFSFLLTTILMVFSSISFAQDKPAFSNLDVFELEWVTNPQISPDGQWVVYQRRGMDIMKDRRLSRLWIMKSDGTQHKKLTNREVSEGSPQWSPDGSKIAFTSSTEHGSEIYVYWIDGGQTAKLTQLERSPRGIRWSPDGTQIAFSMLVPGKAPKLVSPPKKPKGAKWAAHPRVTTRLKHEADGGGYTEQGYTQYFVIPADGGTPRQLTDGDYSHSSGFAWSPDGQHLVFSGNRIENWPYDYRNSELYKVSLIDGTVKTLTDRKGPDHSAVVSPDGKMIAYRGYTDKVQAYQLNKISIMNIDGSGKRDINLNLDRNPNGVKWASDSKGLYFQFDDKGDTKIAHTDLNGKMEVLTGNVGGTAIGRPYDGGSFTVSKNGTIAFTYGTAYHPAELGVTKPGQKSAKISQLNADLLGHRELGKVEEVWYKSTIDQLDIQGWIVKPPGYDPAKKYPLLVENHGGPISNYGPWFSPEVQLYASGGYLVFYPNPRGSTGYGEAFGNELYHNYPGEDYQDVMDGVDKVIEMGLVHADSLYVTGGSAGGTMTAWMIGKNNRFRAAAVIKPVMNWISKTLVADNYYFYANNRYPGQPWENFEAYWSFSPISLVGNIETPTLVMVGTKDLRTPLSEAIQLYHALKIRQIETALVEVPGASHNIANRPSQLITKVDHILAWFEQYR
ncbi:MAG: S9 family peptidase [Bacteroidota bacterium]